MTTPEGIDIEQRIARARAEHPGKTVDCYLTFEDHTDAMAMHEHARTLGLNARVSTTPRQIQASCGVALLVSAGEARAVIDAARAAGLPFEDAIVLERQINPRRDRYC